MAVNIDNELESLHGIIDDIYHQAYNEGFRDGHDKPNTVDSYNKGMNDAWDLVKKLYSEITGFEMIKMFGTSNDMEVIEKFTPEEVMETIQTFKEKKAKEEEYHIGDEVRNIVGTTFVVTYISTEPHHELHGVTPYGLPFRDMDKEEWYKTGRSFPEMVSLLKMMKEYR